MDYLNKETLGIIFKGTSANENVHSSFRKMDPSHSGKLTYLMTKMNIKLMVYIINKRIQFGDVENKNILLLKLAETLKYQQQLPLVTIIDYKQSF